MDQWQPLLAQFREMWRGLGGLQRAVLTGVPLAVLAVATLAIVRTADKSDEVPLLGGKILTTPELRAAQTALARAGLGQFREEGGRLIVRSILREQYERALSPGPDKPQSAANDLRQSLDPGKRLIPLNERERQDLGDLEKRETIVRIIRENPRIATAELLCSRSRPAGFSRQGRMTASLSISPRQGAELSPDDYRSLQQLVAGVWGMSPDDVTVFNTHSGLTFDPTRGSTVRPDDVSERERKLTGFYRRKIADALAHIPGVEVSVQVEAASPVTQSPATPVASLPAIRAIVSIPAEYYESKLAGSRHAPQSAESAGATWDRLRSRTENEVLRTVAGLLPPVTGRSPSDLIHVSSGSRAESSVAPLPDPAARDAHSPPSVWICGGLGAGLALIVAARFRRWKPGRATATLASVGRGNLDEQEHADGEQPLDQSVSNGTDRERARLAADERPSRENAPLAHGESVATARDRLDLSLGPAQAADWVGRVRQSLSHAPFKFLHAAQPDVIVSFLSDENPQTVALVLANLPPEQAAAVLQGMPTTRRLEIVRRVASSSSPAPDVLEVVERSLQQRMTEWVTSSDRNEGGAAAAARLLSVVDRPTHRTILQALESDSPDVADAIRRRLLRFDDMLRLDEESFLAVADAVEVDVWAVALRGTAHDVAAAILRRLPPVMAAGLREELRHPAPVRLSDLTEAQERIASVARRQEPMGQ